MGVMSLGIQKAQKLRSLQKVMMQQKHLAAIEETMKNEGLGRIMTLIFKGLLHQVGLLLQRHFAW